MVGQDMDAAVAPAEKRAQYPRHNPNHDRAPECAPKIIDVKAGHNVRDEPEQQTVDDENKKSERE